MSRAKRTKRNRKHVSLAPSPYNGDHGANTPAATAGTVIEPITNDDGKNPNHMARRYRKDVWKAFSLTMRQAQAAQALRDSYCKVASLSSGGPLKERVQSSSRPDATVDHQCLVQSELVYMTQPLRRVDQIVCEHVLRDNRPLTELKRGNPVLWIPIFKKALDKVADRLRY